MDREKESYQELYSEIDIEGLYRGVFDNQPKNYNLIIRIVAKHSTNYCIPFMYTRLLKTVQ